MHDHPIDQETNYERIATGILENSGLRSALDDDQANRLLTWGLDLIREVTKQVDNLPPLESFERLETYANDVSRVLRYINRLIRDIRRPPDPAYEDLELPAKISDALTAVFQDKFTSEHQASVETIFNNRQVWTADIIFNEMMKLLEQISGCSASNHSEVDEDE